MKQTSAESRKVLTSTSLREGLWLGGKLKQYLLRDYYLFADERPIGQKIKPSDG